MTSGNSQVEEEEEEDIMLSEISISEKDNNLMI